MSSFGSSNYQLAITNQWLKIITIRNVKHVRIPIQLLEINVNEMEYHPE